MQLAQFLMEGGLNDLLQEPPEPTLIPDPPADPTLIRIRVDLDGSTPRIWRRLEVRGDLSMAEFHDVLQCAMGWTDSHLHRFWLGPTKRIWQGPHLVNALDEDEFGDDPGVAAEEDVRVDQLLRAPKDRLFYTYDFGDGWHHTITVEQVRPATDDDPSAICLTGKNACPLEDCGGIPGHEEILELLTTSPDRSNWPEHLASWVPPQWDPRAFDVEETNQLLALRGASLEEALAAAGFPSQHPALMAYVERLDPRYVASFASLSAHALDPAAAEPSPLEVRAAVRPWQLLLSRAGEDGIELTSAGWMHPAAVEQLASELGIDQWWIGKTNRKYLARPLAELREHAMQLGLLRRYKGRLVRTPRGRALDGHPELLWSLLAESMLPESDRGTTEFVTDATVVVLTFVAAGSSDGAAAPAGIAELLTAAGWSIAGRPVSETDALAPCREALSTIDWIGGGARRTTAWQPSPTQQAFARRALTEPL